MEDAREARRKKLINRGTDRLAFITGQSPSLRPTLDYQPLTQPPASVSLSEENVTGSASTKTQASNQNSSSKVESDAGKEALPLSSTPPKIGISSEISQFETNSESSKNMTSSYGNRATGSTPRMSLTVFTFKQISSSISASEDIRLLCSLVIALLVVILHHAQALSINFRPFLLLLLTDITAVFGLILPNQERKGDEETRSREQEGDGLTIDTGNLFEAAILFQKAVGAFFGDCSICAIIMICGIVV